MASFLTEELTPSVLYRKKEFDITEKIINPTTVNGKKITFYIAEIGAGFIGAYLSTAYASTAITGGNDTDFIKLFIGRTELSHYSHESGIEQLKNNVYNMVDETFETSKNNLIPILMGKLLDPKFDGYYHFMKRDMKYSVEIVFKQILKRFISIFTAGCSFFKE